MYGKIKITGRLTVRTGLHIGGNEAFSAIGAIDSPVVKDPFTGNPIIPGSSLKGKIRTLLARSLAQDIENMPLCSEDDPVIQRMFGSTADKPQAARFQFVDLFLSKENKTDLVGLTEAKAENYIDRKKGTATPRQIERIVAGTIFDFVLVYDAVNQDEAVKDFRMLSKGLKLLQMDYLGGHGTRGSGRVSLSDFALTPYGCDLDMKPLQKSLDEAARYELFSV